MGLDRPRPACRPGSPARSGRWTGNRSAPELLWIIDSYAFLLAGSLITMGTLGDRIGRRRLLLFGAAAFGVASVLAAYAPTAGLLIVARGLLGIAGATLMPSTLSLVTAMFEAPAQRRGRGLARPRADDDALHRPGGRRRATGPGRRGVRPVDDRAPVRWRAGYRDPRHGRCDRLPGVAAEGTTDAARETLGNALTAAGQLQDSDAAAALVTSARVAFSNGLQVAAAGCAVVLVATAVLMTAVQRAR